MTKLPKVSVLMPVYNAEKNLKECINSILSQTYNDFELILLDDCSTDKSVEIIKSYNDSRIKLYQNEKNEGISSTRNKLMDLARGEYWALSDNDDISISQRFEKQVAYLDMHPDVGVVSCWQEYFPEKKIIQPKENYTYLDLIKWHPHLPHPCAMLRASVFKEHNIRYNDAYRYAEDYDVWYQIITFTKISVIQEVLYLYRWDRFNASIKHWETQMSHSAEIKQKLLDRITDDRHIQDKLMFILYNEIPCSYKSSENIKKICIPILTIKKKKNIKKIKLFGFIPFIKIKKSSK